MVEGRGGGGERVRRREVDLFAVVGREGRGFGVEARVAQEGGGGLHFDFEPGVVRWGFGEKEGRKEQGDLREVGEVPRDYVSYENIGMNEDSLFFKRDVEEGNALFNDLLGQFFWDADILQIQKADFQQRMAQFLKKCWLCLWVSGC